jgi:hypothetical protein
MVQPPSGAAAAGFSTGERPPAQWLNWQLNRTGAWLDYLRGPNVEHWTRVSAGSEVITQTNRPLAIDVATVDVTGAAFRYAMVGEATGSSDAVIRVSKTGAEWADRTNAPETRARVTALAVSGAKWVLATQSGALYYGAVDNGTGTGPLASSSNAWVGSTQPGPFEVSAFARGASRLFALGLSQASDVGVYSDDDGANWTACTVTGTARSGDAHAAVFDGVRWVFVTQTGQAYASSDGATFAYKSTFTATSVPWYLAAGVSGEVIAYRRTSGTTVGDFYRSTDGGVSWSTITPSSSRKPVQITSLRYASGQWIASSAVAPYLWSSNDLVAWRPLRPPVTGSASPAVDAVAWDGSAWCAVGRSFALQCLRAADPGGATYDGEDGGSTLADAGYLRGREVSATAPSVGDVLTWDGSTWAPAASGGGGGGTTITFAAATLVTLTPGSFPAYVKLSGRARQAGGAGRWHGTIEAHVYDSGGGVYAIDAVRTEGGTVSPTVTVNSATGQVKVLFPVAMTGRLLAVEV